MKIFTMTSAAFWKDAVKEFGFALKRASCNETNGLKIGFHFETIKDNDGSEPYFINAMATDKIIISSTKDDRKLELTVAPFQLNYQRLGIPYGTISLSSEKEKKSVIETMRLEDLLDKSIKKKIQEFFKGGGIDNEILQIKNEEENAPAAQDA